MQGVAYQTSTFWEWALTHHDVWQGFFRDAKHVPRPVFIHTSITKASCGLYDQNWACYPDMHAVLGFLLHVFTPATFCLLNHSQNDQLYIPVATTAQHIDSLVAMHTPTASAMAVVLMQLETLWQERPNRLHGTLETFCEGFSKSWTRDGVQVHVRAFPHTLAIARYVRKVLWADDVFCEDLGITPAQFKRFCTGFYGDPPAREMFMRFLNHRVEGLS